MPQSLYESMACGSYPLLGDLPSYRELITHGVNGHLVPVEVDALASAMSWVALHRERLAEVAQHNRHLIQEIADRSEQARLVNNLYSDLIADRLTGSKGLTA